MIEKEYIIHKPNEIEALDHGLGSNKNVEVIKFNQKTSLKSYIDMNTELKKNKK